MSEYEFNIKETYRGTIIIEADTLEEAREKYKSCEIDSDLALTGERCDWEILGKGKKVK